MPPEERLFRHRFRGASEEQLSSIIDLYSTQQLHTLAETSEHLRHVPRDQIAYLDLARWGLRRHMRKCNDCLYNTHCIHRQNIKFGLATFSSRYLRFSNPLDRYFPGYSDVLLHRRPQGDLPRHASLGVTHMPYTTYMLRCRHCSKWSELRNFASILEACQGVLEIFSRENELRISERGSTVDEICRPGLCNECLIQKSGTTKAGEILLGWFRKVKNFSLAIIEEQLICGWVELRKECLRARDDISNMTEEIRDSTQQSRLFFEKYGNLIDSLMTDVSPLIELRPNYDNLSAIQETSGDEQTPELTTRQVDFLRINVGLVKCIFELANLPGQPGYKTRLLSWAQDYGTIEKYWNWVRDSWQEIESNPQTLIEWALSQDPLSLK